MWGWRGHNPKRIGSLPPHPTTHPHTQYTHTHIQVIPSIRIPLCVSGGDGYWMGSVGFVALVSDFSLLVNPTTPPHPPSIFIVCLLNERGGAIGASDWQLLLTHCSSLCLCQRSLLSVLYPTLNNETFFISGFCLLSVQHLGGFVAVPSEWEKGHFVESTVS